MVVGWVKRQLLRVAVLHRATPRPRLERATLWRTLEFVVAGFEVGSEIFHRRLAVGAYWLSMLVVEVVVQLGLAAGTTEQDDRRDPALDEHTVAGVRVVALVGQQVLRLQPREGFLRLVQQRRELRRVVPVGR